MGQRHDKTLHAEIKNLAEQVGQQEQVITTLRIQLAAQINCGAKRESRIQHIENVLETQQMHDSKQDEMLNTLNNTGRRFKQLLIDSFNERRD